MYAPLDPWKSLTIGPSQDIIMTDDQRIPWLEAQGKFYFLENRDFALGDLSRELAQLKEQAPLEWRREGMSVLLPQTPQVASASATIPWLQQAFEDVKVMMPASYFIDDGTPALV